MLKLTTINRSGWPNWWINAVAQEVAERAGIAWDYSLTIRGTSRPWTYRGLGNRRRSSVLYHRRATTGIVKEHRYKWATDRTVPRGPLSMVFLIAHEMYHATGGHPDKWTTAGRCNVDAMEEQCNLFGLKMVDEYRQWGPKMLRASLAGLRRQRIRAREKDERRAAKTMQAEAPSARIAAQQAKLKRWETKAKRADTAIRKLRRSIQALERRAALILTR